MILKRKNHNPKKHIVKITFNQLLIILPETKLLYKAAIMDYYGKNRSTIPFRPFQYYCGITNDVARRQQEHKAQFLDYINVNKRHRAYLIEMVMESLGFDTGRKSGNGGRKNSTYVYIYRKIKGVTKEIVK